MGPGTKGEIGEVLFVDDADLMKAVSKAERLCDKFDYEKRGIAVDVDRIPGAFERDQTVKSVKVKP